MRLSLLAFCFFLLSALVSSCGRDTKSSSEGPAGASPLPPTTSPVLTSADAPEAPLAAAEPSGSDPGSQALSPLPFVYQTQELLATREVFEDFGELSIDPSLISQPGENKIIVVKVPDAALPWSAFWYPKRGDQLFSGSESPMFKLDEYFRKFGLPKGAQEWETLNHNDGAADWEGLCDAWAVASILTREPKAKIREMGIDFLPSDLKAIAIKYFEGYASKVYGLRYQGSASTDGQIQDLRPEAFHKLVEVVIGQQQRPLIVDEDPGPEIWSKPLFRMSFSYTLDPKFENAILVKAFPWMIRQRSSVDENPTSVAADLAAPKYEYRLFYERDTFPLRIIGGEWIGASINSHPDMVFIPNTPENSKQYNSGVRQNNEQIRKLLVKVGMLSE